MHEPDRGRGPGQRLQQLHDPVRGNEVHDHQVDREGLQVRAVPDRPRPGALGPGRGVDLPAPALDLVLLVLGDCHGDPRDLVLLVAVGHAQVPGPGQVSATLAAALREHIPLLVRGVGPGQMRPRRPALLAPRPLRPAPPRCGRLLRNRGFTRAVIPRGRARGVPRVPRQQMLHLRQLGRQRLVGLRQLSELPSHLGDLTIPHHKQREQLLTRELLRHRHPTITPHTSRSRWERHAQLLSHTRPPGPHDQLWAECATGPTESRTGGDGGPQPCRQLRRRVIPTAQVPACWNRWPTRRVRRRRRRVATTLRAAPQVPSPKCPLLPSWHSVGEPLPPHVHARRSGWPRCATAGAVGRPAGVALR